MARSMTGFGRGVWTHPAGWTVTAEVRGTNHRYLDLVMRLPAGWGELEGELRELCRAYVRRGRCEVSLQCEQPAGASTFSVDRALLEKYHDTLRDLANHYGLSRSEKASVLLAFPGVLRLSPVRWDVEALRLSARNALEAALRSFDGVRRTEGEALRNDLLRRIERLQEVCGRLQGWLPQLQEAAVRQQRERLQALLAELGDGAVADTERWATMQALLWERLDLAEELVRIQSHLAQLGSALDGDDEVGRRCDFLAQELYREWNTVASKATDAAVTALAVEAKLLVEQIREQAQNLE